jgi:NTE family protein
MPQHDDSLERCVPVEIVDTGSAADDPRAPLDGVALCLSGGGYRAMLFHLGALWRLNEFGFLPKLSRVSSVSGGSITAGVLGLKWSRLGFDGDGIGQKFQSEVVEPIRTLAGRTIDEGSILGGILTPGSIGEKVAESYDQFLLGGATLQDLPDDPPRFVINATNVQTGALFRFSKPFLADYRVGTLKSPRTRLALAVAASAAFPPVLSPVKLEFDASEWEPPSRYPSEDLHAEPYLTDVVLTDGGVYDNLGLETAWKKFKTILVSDGGGKMAPEPEPKRDWARHSLRINDIIDNQVRSLRKRQLLASYHSSPHDSTHRNGTYWGIRSHMMDYGTPGALPCPEDKTLILANTRTRLKRLDPVVQERIINWGYAICDAAMRKWVDPSFPVPQDFPYRASGVG